MNHYQRIEDFLSDDSFCKWIMSGKAENDLYWANWQKNNMDKQELMEEASQLVLQLQFHKEECTEAEIEGELDKLFQKIPPTTVPIKQIKPKNTNYKKWAVAASLALMLTVGWIILNFLEVGLVTHQTAYGEIKEFQLSDETRVVLQANSTLSFPEKWEEGEARIVHLEGEAFFDVVTTSSKSKFMVQGEDFQVEVLGTAFNVLSREATKRIALEEGKIRFNSANQSLELAPDELLTYHTDSKKFVKSTAKAAIHTMWTKKVLQIDRMNLKELIRIIEDNYGYTVQTNLTNTNVSKEVIGTIPINQLEDLLMLIEGAYGLEVKKENRLITLFSK